MLYSFPSTIMVIDKERRRSSSEQHLKYAIAINLILKNTLHKKSLPSRISSVNVTKSAVTAGLVNIRT